MREFTQVQLSQAQITIISVLPRSINLSSSRLSCYYGRTDAAWSGAATEAGPCDQTTVCLCLCFSHIMVSLLPCASLILLVGMAILAWQLWRRHGEETFSFLIIFNIKSVQNPNSYLLYRSMKYFTHTEYNISVALQVLHIRSWRGIPRKQESM